MQIKKVILIIVITLLAIVNLKETFALDDGAYLIGRSTSYVNPITDKTEDGGTNIALGDSMVASIVEKNLLVEQTQGKIYLTIGLGLASNVSNVRFKVMDSNGSMKTVSATKTGSSQANGDTVNHYRIQISSLTDYISPVMYITPMGRDVQFFIKLNSSSMSEGTGIYKSEMIVSSNQETKKSTTDSTNKTTDNETSKETKTQEKKEQVTEEKIAPTTVEEVTKESLFKDVKGLSEYNVETSKQDYSIYWISGLLIVAFVVIGGFIYVKKIKK